MDKAEIVTQLARDRVVEEMVRNITGQPLEGDLKDLAQMVYLYLLEYPEDRLRNLHENGEMRFFIARIIINQYTGSRSQFYTLYRKSFKRNVEISKYDFADGEE